MSTVDCLRVMQVVWERVDCLRDLQMVDKYSTVGCRLFCLIELYCTVGCMRVLQVIREYHIYTKLTMGTVGRLQVLQVVCKCCTAGRLRVLQVISEFCTVGCQRALWVVYEYYIICCQRARFRYSAGPVLGDCEICCSELDKKSV